MKKKTTTREAQPVDSLSLSFLDVLSCGLAAMLVLFFVFSMLPQGKEDMTASAKGAGNDQKTSQSGVRAKGLFARPDQSPFGLVVVLKPKDGADVAITPDDIEWKHALGVEWVGLVNSSAPAPEKKESGEEPESEIAPAPVAAQSVARAGVEPRYAQNAQAPSQTAQEPSQEGSETTGQARISGFTQNAPRNFKDVSLWLDSEKLNSYRAADVEIIGTVDRSAKYRLDFTIDATPTEKDGKTLLLTVDRTSKNDWLKSVYLKETDDAASELGESVEERAAAAYIKFAASGLSLAVADALDDMANSRAAFAAAQDPNPKNPDSVANAAKAFEDSIKLHEVARSFLSASNDLSLDAESLADDLDPDIFEVAADNLAAESFAGFIVEAVADSIIAAKLDADLLRNAISSLRASSVTQFEIKVSMRRGVAEVAAPRDIIVKTLEAVVNKTFDGGENPNSSNSATPSK